MATGNASHSNEGNGGPKIKEGRLFAMLDFLGCSGPVQRENNRAGVPEDTMFHRLIHSARVKSPLYAPATWLVTDSIFVYQPPPEEQDVLATQSTSPENVSIESFVWLCAMLLRESILRTGDDVPQAPLRGAISWGEALVGPTRNFGDRPGYMMCAAGKAVVEAHLWERCQKWIGASVSPQSLDALHSNYSDQLVSARRHNLLVDWDVPTANGCRKTLAVNFVEADTAHRLQRMLAGALSSPLGVNERRKYEETLEFVETMAAGESFIEWPEEKLGPGNSMKDCSDDHSSCDVCR